MCSTHKHNAHCVPSNCSHELWCAHHGKSSCWFSVSFVPNVPGSNVKNWTLLQLHGHSEDSNLHNLRANPLHAARLACSLFSYRNNYITGAAAAHKWNKSETKRAFVRIQKFNPSKIMCYFTVHWISAKILYTFSILLRIKINMFYVLWLSDMRATVAPTVVFVANMYETPSTKMLHILHIHPMQYTFNDVTLQVHYFGSSVRTVSRVCVCVLYSPNYADNYTHLNSKIQSDFIWSIFYFRSHFVRTNTIR